jgi:2-polyprenyl-6-methoxyphenol hydroxylase-like FAD-dependent oxidoreductase
VNAENAGVRANDRSVPVDVLVVGAGPTGLTLAAQLRAFGARFRVVDRQLDRVHESRALAIQPRTLEVLADLGVTADLVARGNPAVQLRMHLGRRVVSVPLYDRGLDDTAYPFLLVLSQAETERVLSGHLGDRGVAIERGVELVGLEPEKDRVTCRLVHHDGRPESVAARHVVGCDGAHSAVRELARIPFVGAAYPQTFLLADLEVDGLEPDAAHAYVTGAGMLLFFPLRTPASWRMLAMRPRSDHDGESVGLARLQAIVDAYSREGLRLRDPVWMTDFRLHNRGATRYRAGSVFLAGDAAHIHSPAGAQGMNTGIQDAVNLGWKLAMVARGIANPALLDTYELERAPIGRAILRLTDRAFTIATTNSAVVQFARAHLASRLVPLVLRSAALRTAGFRVISELGIHYRRSPTAAGSPRERWRTPRPGDRLPDAAVTRNGQPMTLHAAVATPGLHLLWCGPLGAWPSDRTGRPSMPFGDLVTVLRLTREDRLDVLRSADGAALSRLGLEPADTTGQILVRPDGYIGYRSRGTDMTGLYRYLRRWFWWPGATP